MPFNSVQDAEIYVLEHYIQEQGRGKSETQIAEATVSLNDLVEDLQQAAKERMSPGTNQYTKGSGLHGDQSKSETGRTTQKIAEKRWKNDGFLPWRKSAMKPRLEWRPEKTNIKKALTSLEARAKPMLEKMTGSLPGGQPEDKPGRIYPSEVGIQGSQPELGRTSQKLAEKAGVSKSTIERVMAVHKKGVPELRDMMARTIIVDCYTAPQQQISQVLVLPGVATEWYTVLSCTPAFLAICLATFLDISPGGDESSLAGTNLPVVLSCSLVCSAFLASCSIFIFSSFAAVHLPN